MRDLVANPFVRAGALAAMTLAAYLPAMRAGFIWDDDDFLTANPLIRAPDGLRRFWLSAEPPDYFPLTSSMLWVEWRLWGMHAAGYHVVNVLLHAGSAILLWRVLGALEIPAAWLGAALFALHPVNVESVAWITERKNTLPMALYLLSLLLYLRFDSGAGRRLYTASLGVFLLALLAKTSVVMLPVVLLACAWWRRRGIARRDLLRAVPFFALAVAMGLVTVWFQYHRAMAGWPVRTDGLLSRTLLAGRAVWFYLYKALAPVSLCFVYPRWTADASSWVSYLPLAALAGTFAAAWRFRRSWGRGVLMALGYFVVALLPVLGFLNIFFMRYSLVADHWQYLSLIGPLALAAGAWGRVHRALEHRSHWVPVAAAGALLAGLGALSYRQAGIYDGPETLWRDTLKKNPRCWLAYDQLGALHANRAETLSAKGEMAARDDEMRQAVECFDKALDLEPGHHEGHYLLARALAGPPMLQTAEAITHYRQAIRIRPEYVDALSRLAWLLATHPDANFRDGGEARQLAETACRVTDRRALFPLAALAAACAENGQFDQAVKVAVEAADLAEATGQANAARGLREQVRGYYRLRIPYREDPGAPGR